MRFDFLGRLPLSIFELKTNKLMNNNLGKKQPRESTTQGTLEACGNILKSMGRRAELEKKRHVKAAKAQFGGGRESTPEGTLRALTVFIELDTGKKTSEAELQKIIRDARAERKKIIEKSGAIREYYAKNGHPAMGE